MGGADGKAVGTSVLRQFTLPMMEASRRNWKPAKSVFRNILAATSRTMRMRRVLPMSRWLFDNRIHPLHKWTLSLLRLDGELAFSSIIFIAMYCDVSTPLSRLY